MDGLADDVDELLHLRGRLGDLEVVHPARHALDAVQDVVEAAGEAVDVLPVERGDEGLPELGEDLVGDHVPLVLDVLDVLVFFFYFLVVVHELLKGQDAGLEVGRVLAEEPEKLLVLGEESELHAGFPKGGNIFEAAGIVK